MEKTGGVDSTTKKLFAKAAALQTKQQQQRISSWSSALHKNHHLAYAFIIIALLLVSAVVFRSSKWNFQVLDDPSCHCDHPRFDNRPENARGVKYEETTCSREASQMGRHQKVIAFSYFKASAAEEQSRHYFAGIEANVEAIGRLYPGWTMRLYHNRDDWKDDWICNLACVNHDKLQLCNVNENPMFGNASILFPTIWRFLPLLDDQVDVALFRDLDSLPSQREVDAVNEWLRSKHAFHVMRDHPGHDMAVLAGMWGLKMEESLRPGLRAVFLAMLKSPLAYWSDDLHGSQDQALLTRYFWPWAKTITLQHDSFHCDLFSRSRPWPTQRLEGVLNNFVGAPVALNSSLTDDCPLKCRPRDHPEWHQC